MWLNNLFEEAKRRIRVFKAALVFLGVAVFACFFFFTVFPKTVVMELGENRYLSARDFIINDRNHEAKLVTDFSKIDFKLEAKYSVMLSYRGRLIKAHLLIRDTKAPVVSLVSDPVYYIGTELKVEDLVSKISDYSEYKLYFKDDYEFTNSGVYVLELVAIDEYGNRNNIKCSLNVKVDDEAPTVLYDHGLYVRLGEKDVDFTKGLDYEDNISPKEKLSVSILESNFDVNNPGIYDICLGIKDEFGNECQVKRRAAVYSLSVGEISLFERNDDFDLIAEELFKEILTEDMTPREEVLAIYNWTRENITYKSARDFSFVDQLFEGSSKAAIDLYNKRRGCCYDYACLISLLLSRRNIPNILVLGQGSLEGGGYGIHCWSLVYMDGKWLHVDALYGQLIKSIDYGLVSSNEIYPWTHLWDGNQYPWE